MKKIGVFLVGVLLAGMAYATDPEPDTKQIVTSQYYVDRQFEGKQPILEPQQDNGDYVVLYPVAGGEDGAVRARKVVTTVTNAANTDLLTVGGVNTELNKKQDALAGSSANAGKLVTYSSTVGGTTGIVETYNSASAYSGTALVHASDVNTGIAAGINRHLECVDWETGHENNDNWCLLWQINTLDATTEQYLPHATSGSGV